MAYNRENYIRLKKEYESKSLNAKKAAEARASELRLRLKDLADIDRQLQMTGLQVLAEAFKGKEGLETRIAELEKQNKVLLDARKACLRYNGYPEDYTDVKYDCRDCMDTGFIGTKMCHCFKKALIKAGFESSGIGALLETQSFSSFDLSYYSDDKQTYETMKNNLKKCRHFAETFAKGSPNLLLCGGTGLGKTHMSTAIAKEVIERGYDVVYDTTQNIVNDFEKEHFKGADESTVSKYFDCDLLIMDDLGTEMKTSFSIACIYNIINTRLNSGKSTIINTNLVGKALLDRYEERITSRLLGCFEPTLFKGKDIRLKKLQ